MPALCRLPRTLILLVSFSFLGLASPVAAQSDEAWSFTDINRNYCIINASQNGIGVSVWMKRTGSNGEVELRAAGDVPRLNHASYLGSVKFDHGISVNASLAGVVKDAFGITVFVWSIDDASFLTLLGARNSVLLDMGGTSVATISLAGSGKAVGELLKCSGWKPPADNGKFYVDELTITKLEEVLWKDSRSWAINRYVPNSVFRTEGREMLNARNFTFRAWYKYNRDRIGHVDVEIVNGKINCVRYHDRPFDCKRIY